MGEPSVRVDVRGDDAVPPLDAPAPPPRRRRWIGGLLVALAVLGAGIFFLRPDSGQAADGSVRQATTTTSTAAPTSTLAEETSTGLAVDVVEGLEGVSVGFESFVVVPGPPGAGGYFGSPAFGPTGSTPEIYRSLNGQNWIQVETAVIDDGELLPDDGEAFDPVFNEEFNNFHRRDDGFGIFRIRSTRGDVIESELLVSDDGALWRMSDGGLLDESEAGSFGFPVLIDGEAAFVSARDEFGVTVLEQSGLEAPVDNVCFVNPISVDTILLSPCDDAGGSVSIERSEVPDVDAFDRVFDCLETTQGSGLAFFEIRFPEQSTEPGLFSTQRQLLGVPIRIASGELVGFVEEVPTPSAACEVLGDFLPPRSGQGLAIWNGPGTADVIELNGAPGLVPNGFFGVQPMPLGDTFFTLADLGVWAVQRDGSVELVVELDRRTFGDIIPASLVLIEDHLVLSQVMDGMLIQDRIAGDGSVERIVHSLADDGPLSNAREFVYVDSEIVLFTDGTLTLRRIEPAEPS